MKINFQIDQRLDLLCDEFQFYSPSLGDFLDEKEDYAVSHGYGDKEITLEGTADEWTISRGNNKEFSLSVKCRDKIKAALETYFQKTYFRDVGNYEGSYVSALPMATGGRYMASSIAKEACQAAGLGLLWACPDYKVINDKEPSRGFNGTVAKVLQELIQPLQKTEMFKVDMFIRGNTVHIKKRYFPYTADYSMNLDDVRILSISISKINYPPLNDNGDRAAIKTVQVEGSGTDEPTGGGGADPGTGGAGSGIILFPRTEVTITETKDNDGKVLTRLIETSDYINNILTKVVKQLYKRTGRYATMVSVYTIFDLFEEETTIYRYGRLGLFTPTSDYHLLYDKTTTANVYQERKTPILTSLGFIYLYLAKKSLTVIKYDYSLDDEILMEDIYKETKELDENGNIKMDTSVTPPVPLYTIEKETIVNKRLTQDLVETTKKSYLNDQLITEISQTYSGQLPGPKKVGRIKNVNDDMNDPDYYKKDETIDPDGTANIFYELSPFSEKQGDIIIDEIKLEQLSRRYELSMEILPMPWLYKGQGLNLQGVIKDGLGNEWDISQYNWLITSLRYRRTGKEYIGSLEAITYDEPRDTNKSVDWHNTLNTKAWQESQG